jgi:hypothetical protein
MLHFFSHRCGRVVHTVYSIDARTGFWKGFSRPARFIILAQTLVIGFLSFWVHQEYLNNLYLRIYVNNMVQTTGWAFALLAVIVVLGTVMTVVSKSKNSKKAELEMVESMTTEVETPTPAATQAAVRPTIDLHPMVAQLKADLAGTHMPIESVPVPKLEETPASLGVQTPVTTNPPSPPTPLTPSTVVIGVVPVQKKEKQTPAEEKPHTEEEAKATAEAKGPPNS